MTDQPKPTPLARPQCTELTSEQLLAELDALLRESNLATLRWMETAAKRDAENAELTADLRTASDQCEALSKNLADHKRQLDTMVEENRRLRHLLRQYKHRLDKRWREGTRMDAYARGYQDGLEAAEVIFDDVFNAIGRTGE